jgi:glycerol-3-phosphate acyltransferase PlsY
MDISLALTASLVGYLVGSVSFARLISKRVAPGTNISLIRQPIPNTNITFESDSISASTVRINVGTRYGCLTAFLDMLKVALPAFIFRFWLPEFPYFLLSAMAGVVGHDYPLYYRFKGGRGESPIIGGMLSIDPIGLIVTNLLGIGVGWLVGDVLVLRWSFLILLIPWMWLRFNDPLHILYAVVVNIIYWTAMIPELKQFFKILKDGGLSSQEEIAGDMAMGKELGRFLDQYGVPALLRKLSRKNPTP